MTAAIAFDALAERKIRLGDIGKFSQRGWQIAGAPQGGTSMFLERKHEPTVDELLKGLIVTRGHDAAYTLADLIGGNQEEFLRIIRNAARKMLLTQTEFANSTGLSDENQYSSAADLAKIARYILINHRNYYHYYAIRKFKFHKVEQRNTNPMLQSVAGGDGLVTGFAEGYGFGLVGSVKRDNRRLIGVLAGVQSRHLLSKEAKRLFNWGFKQFKAITIADRHETISRAKVYGGASGRVAVATKSTVAVTIAKADLKTLRIRHVYQGPLYAPVRQGARVGSLEVLISGEVVSATPLYASAKVDKGGFWSRSADGIYTLLGLW